MQGRRDRVHLWAWVSVTGRGWFPTRGRAPECWSRQLVKQRCLISHSSPQRGSSHRHWGCAVWTDGLRRFCPPLL